MDATLKHNIDRYLLRGIKLGHDMIILLTGLEGTGKSTFVQSIAHYCDTSLNISRIVFSGTDLMIAIDEARVGQAIIFDEAIMDMSSQDFATDMQKILIKKFTLIRKKRLIIFLVIPSLFMLRKYFAIFRTRAMINCYCPDGLTRGSFRFYSFSKKKKLYLLGQKEMNMGAVKPDFHGRFTNSYGFFVNALEYESKKDEAIKQLTSEDNSYEFKIKQAFEDYKLRLRLDVEKFKDSWKNKFSEQSAKSKDSLSVLKDKYAKSVDGIRLKSIVLQKSSDKKKIQEMEYDYVKLLYVFWKLENISYELKTNGNKYSHNAFRLMLQRENCIGNVSAQKIKSMIGDGERLTTIS